MPVGRCKVADCLAWCDGQIAWGALIELGLGILPVGVLADRLASMLSQAIEVEVLHVLNQVMITHLQLSPIIGQP